MFPTGSKQEDQSEEGDAKCSGHLQVWDQEETLSWDPSWLTVDLLCLILYILFVCFGYVSKLNIDNWNDSRVIGSSDWGIAPEKEKKKKPAEDRWGCSRQLYFVALDGVIELCGNDANEHDLTFVRFIGWDGKVPQTQRNRLIDIGEHSRYDQKQFAAHHDTEIRIMIDLSYWSSFNRIRWRIKMKSSIIKNRSWEKKLA